MFKGGRLKFKGEGSSKHTAAKDTAGASKESLHSEQLPEEIAALPEEGWIAVTELDDFKGPVLFVVPDEPCGVFNVREEQHVLVVDPTGDAMLEEPAAATNVLVGQTLIPQVFSFKSAFNRYLSADHLGQVSVGKEAVGPTEEWTLVLRPDGVALQNVHQKFLSYDRSRGRMRCDSETIGFAETFRARCQAARKRERLVKLHQETKRAQRTGHISGDLKTVEDAEARKHHSFGWGRPKRTNLPGQDTETLQRANEEGNLRETLLERRVKTKHDPFC